MKYKSDTEVLFEKFNLSYTVEDPISFLKKYKAGEIKNPEEEIQDYIEQWRQSDIKISIWEYLGLTPLDYKFLVENPKIFFTNILPTYLATDDEWFNSDLTEEQIKVIK